MATKCTNCYATKAPQNIIWKIWSGWNRLPYEVTINIFWFNKCTFREYLLFSSWYKNKHKKLPKCLCWKQRKQVRVKDSSKHGNKHSSWMATGSPLTSHWYPYINEINFVFHFCFFFLYPIKLRRPWSPGQLFIFAVLAETYSDLESATSCFG